MSAPTICRACGSLMPGNVDAARHVCGCLDALCLGDESPAVVVSSEAAQNSVCNSGFAAPVRVSTASPASFERPAPAPIQPLSMTAQEHNRFPKGRYS